MSFKIVATCARRGGLDITLCPSTWEQNGKLAWPPKNVTRLQSDATSEPEDHWIQYDCILKKSGILSYEEALQWEIAFQNADTDGESELSLSLPAVSKPRRREVLKQLNLSNNELENIIDNVNRTTNVQKSKNVLEEVEVEPCIINMLQVDPGSQTDVALKINDLCTKFDTLKEEIGGIKQSLYEYQIMQNVNNAKVLTMLEKLSNEVCKREFEPCQNQQQTEKEDYLSKYCLPINELEELKKIDKDLMNPEYFKAMEEHFNNFFGTNGQERGEVVGKRMAEQIMTRNLMTEMSWTGVSRSLGCEKKFAFQTFESIIKLFYQVLSKADSRWNIHKNEKLFSGTLLKHAKKRALAEKIKMEKRTKVLSTVEQVTILADIEQIDCLLPMEPPSQD